MNMAGLDTLIAFLEKTSGDGRIGPAHISLFTAILKCWNEQGCPFCVDIVSRDLMSTAKIFSPTTFHRTIRQLDEFGYLKYQGTTNKWECSKIIL